MTTMTETFNPIIDTISLSRFRLWEPLPPAEVNVSFVLFGEDTGLTVLPPGRKLTWGMARWGNYTLYQVDMAPQTLAFTWPLPSSDLGYDFAAEASCVCRVVDPAAVVTNMITDVGREVERHVLPLLRSASRCHGLEDVAQAEAALSELLDSQSPKEGAAFIFSDWNIAIVPDREVVEHKRTRQRREYDHDLADLEGARQAKEHQATVQLLEDEGFKGLYATWLQRRPEDAPHMIQLLLTVEQARRTDYVNALIALAERKDFESFELEAEFRRIVARLGPSLDGNVSFDELPHRGDTSSDHEHRAEQVQGDTRQPE
jgi:hypothetical protein